MGINEKPLDEKEYVVVFRSERAINITCTDVRTKEGWLRMEGPRGRPILTVPSDAVLMVLESTQYARMTEAAELAAAQAATRQSLQVDPQGIMV